MQLHRLNDAVVAVSDSEGQCIDNVRVVRRVGLIGSDFEVVKLEATLASSAIVNLAVMNGRHNPSNDLPFAVAVSY